MSVHVHDRRIRLVGFEDAGLSLKYCAFSKVFWAHARKLTMTNEEQGWETFFSLADGEKPSRGPKPQRVHLDDVMFHMRGLDTHKELQISLGYHNACSFLRWLVTYGFCD